MSGRLRSYARINARSQKVKDGAHDFRAVYAEVDARSDGYCEVTTVAGADAGVIFKGRAVGPSTLTLTRCERRGVEHHHLFRPRRSHHTAREVVRVCRICHERAEYPFARGRLVYVGNVGDNFIFAIRYAASKFQARGQGE